MSVGSPEVVGPDPAAPAWKRWSNLPPSTEECISLITTIFSDSHETEVKNLDKDDAQLVVDAVYQVLPRVYLRRVGLVIWTFLSYRADVEHTAATAPEEVFGCLAQNM